MTKKELLSIITFAESARALSMECLDITEPAWNMVLFVMRRHLENKLVTMTSLAQASGVPYTTAVRKIDCMLADELIIKRPRTVTGKSFSLHPSEALIGRFHEYAWRLKHHIGATFGLPRDEQGRRPYYFGASYLAANILPSPPVMREGIGVNNVLRLLVNDDQTFLVLRRVRRDLEQWLGGRVDITVVPLDELHDRTLENARRDVSEYDIVDFDLPWMGEYAQRGILLALDDLLPEGNVNPPDFHTAAWDASGYNGIQYGLPIEPTPELLFYRRDVLDRLGMQPPTTTDELLAALETIAEAFETPSGIAFCAARGTPIAHFFIQLMGDFGQPPLNLPEVGGDFDLSRMEGEQLRPKLDSPAALATAEFLLELCRFGHPKLPELAWDETVQSFADGEVAMAYGWSGRAARFELNLDSPAYRKAGYVPHPAAPGRECISPMGGYSLGIPSNIAPQRVATAWRAVEYLTSPELVKFYAQNGSLVSSRFSVSADPEVKGLSPIVGVVDGLAQAGHLKFWQRPPVPEFSDMMAVLGNEIHDMILGRTPPRTALESAQTRIDRLMRDHGHY